MSNAGRTFVLVKRGHPAWSAMLARAMREDPRLSLIEGDNECWVRVTWVLEWRKRR